MNNPFEKMQKLAFGKILLKENKIEDHIITPEEEKLIYQYFKDEQDEDITDIPLAGLSCKEASRKIGPYGFEDETLQHILYTLFDEETVEDYGIYENKKITESTLKDKIKELVHSSLGEAKKKKKEPEDVAPQEDTIDMDMDIETPSDTIAPSSTDEIDIDPKVKTIQDSLSKALANAKALGDEKLVNQIGNTITMLVRTQVVGQQVAENKDLNEYIPDFELEGETDWQQGYRNGYNNGYRDASEGKEKEQFNEIQGDPDDYYGYNDPFNPEDYADYPNDSKESNAIIKQYVELLNNKIDDIYDVYNLMAAVEIIKKEFGVKQ